MKKTILLTLTMLFVFSSVVYAQICAPTFDAVGIFTPDAYGVEQPITDVTIILTGDFPGEIQNQPVAVRLLEGSTALDVIDGLLTSVNGTTKVDFDYTHPRTGTITIQAIVGDPSNNPLVANRDVQIRDQLDIILNCPTGAFIDRLTTVSWKVEDELTGELVSVLAPKIDVIQGQEVLATQPTSSSVTFETGVIGSVSVEVEVSKDGYISDVDQCVIIMQEPERTYTLQLDNKDFATYTGKGVAANIEPGVHQLTLSVDEAGENVEIAKIIAEMRTPSGGIDTLEFTKQGDVYKTSYNFPDEGRTYDLSGRILFNDLQDPKEFSFKFNTLAGQSAEERNTTTALFIGGGIGVLILFLIIIVVLFRRK